MVRHRKAGEEVIMLKEEQEYLDYIANHVFNVQMAYFIFSGELKKGLNIDDVKMNCRIYTHDASKYSLEEFYAYRKYFYSVNKLERDKLAFQQAWEHHYCCNDHYPHYWVVNKEALKDRKNIIAKDMIDEAIAEMLCDWIGMSIAKSTSIVEWYSQADEKELFSNNTKAKVDDIMSKDWVKDIHRYSFDR